jgi:hypothetical protein
LVRHKHRLPWLESLSVNHITHSIYVLIVVWLPGQLAEQQPLRRTDLGDNAASSELWQDGDAASKGLMNMDVLTTTHDLMLVHFTSRHS